MISIAWQGVVPMMHAPIMLHHILIRPRRCRHPTMCVWLRGGIPMRILMVPIVMLVMDHHGLCGTRWCAPPRGAHGCGWGCCRLGGTGMGIGCWGRWKCGGCIGGVTCKGRSWVYGLVTGGHGRTQGGWCCDLFLEGNVKRGGKGVCMTSMSTITGMSFHHGCGYQQHTHAVYQHPPPPPPYINNPPPVCQ